MTYGGDRAGCQSPPWLSRGRRRPAVPLRCALCARRPCQRLQFFFSCFSLDFSVFVELVGVREEELMPIPPAPPAGLEVCGIGTVIR